MNHPSHSNKETIKVGGASGYWGDAALATPQLLEEDLDFIVYDYLAEITMSIMAKARATDPNKGYATDFVTAAMKPNLARIAQKGVKIIANAGGVNPKSCAEQLEKAIRESGVNLKVITVLGDDLIEDFEQIQAEKYLEMFSGENIPADKKFMSINAYLGAFPIAHALDQGADIVITGRCVDSAVTLGACIHAFGWHKNDLDLLANASLAGHILECGAQATGGNFTDWELVSDTIDRIGYPIAEISANGDFVCTKPSDSGGLVSFGTVAEQMLYEIGDPRAYLLPDVTCDFSAVEIDELAPNRVSVSGAKGLPPPPTYKVCATYEDGFRGGLNMTFYGIDANRKAKAFADALFRRCNTLLKRYNLPAFTETDVEVIGAESQYAEAARRVDSVREVVVKIAAKNPEAAGIGLLLKEAAGMGLSAPPGLSGFAGGRPRPSPIAKLFSLALPKTKVDICHYSNGDTTSWLEPSDSEPTSKSQPSETAAADTFEFAEVQPQSDWPKVALVKLAYGRSGDKGNYANVGIIARKPEYMPYINYALSTENVKVWFSHFISSTSVVNKYSLPGVSALNFVLTDILGGGGVASLRNDPQGKGYAQILLDHPVSVPPNLLT